MYLRKKILLTIIINFMVYCVLCSPPNGPRPPRMNGEHELYYMRPPPAPPTLSVLSTEPTFMERIANWIYNPFGLIEDSQPAPAEIDQQYIASNNIDRIRDIEPTTARPTLGTVSNVTPLRCHPCNKIPWIPMIPTYQMPLLNTNSQSGPYPSSVGFKHHFGDEKPYSEISTPRSSSNDGGYNYPNPPNPPPVSTLTPDSVTPLKFVGYDYAAPQITTPATIYGSPIQHVNIPATVYGSAVQKPNQQQFSLSGLQSNVTPVSITYGTPIRNFNSNPTPPAPSYGLPEPFTYRPFKDPKASIKPLKLQASPTPQKLFKPQSYYQTPIKQQQQGNFNLPQSYYKPQLFKPQSYYPSTASTFPGGAPLKLQQGYYQNQDNANIPITTFAPQLNTIDTSVILLTTPPPNDGRPSRFTMSSSVTNSEYLPPPNILPLENESANYVPIPIPNLSATPIPPLFNAQSFDTNPYLRPNPNPIINFVPFVPDSLPQLSNIINIQSASNQTGDSNVQVIPSVPLAEFTTTVTEYTDNYGNRFATNYQSNFRVPDIDLNLNNNLSEELDSQSQETTDPPVVTSTPTVFDSVSAGSENKYKNDEKSKTNAYGGFQNNYERTTARNLEIIRNRYPQSNQDEQKSRITTTESNNIIVEFQPSLQTFEDLADRKSNYENAPKANIKPITVPPFKPLRNTFVPKEISTMLTTQTTTVRPTKTTAVPSTTTTTASSPLQPLRDLTKKITQFWSSSVLPVTTSVAPKIRIQTQSPITTPAPVSSTPFVPDYTKQLSRLWTTRTAPPTTTTEQTPAEEVTTLSFISTVLPKATITDTEIAESSGVFAGITPPLPPSKPQSTKKPKQIQIIIPYTTYHEPAPFKIPNENDKPLIYPKIVPVRGHYITHPQNYRKGSEEKNEIIDDIKSEIEDDAKIIEFKPKPGVSYNIQDILAASQEIRNQNKNEIKKDDMFNGHGYQQDIHNDQEYSDHAEESQIIEAKITTKTPTKTQATRKMTPYHKTISTTKTSKYVPINRKTTTTKPAKYITKIVASNIKELLKKERTPKPNRIDVIRLQKNIDGWTEQSFAGKASTISLTGHTKSIPKVYLTTTMSPLVFATTLSTLTTFNSDLMEEARQQYERILYKNEENLMTDLNSVKRNDVTRFLDKNHDIILFNNNLTYDANDGVEIDAPKPTIQPRELWNKLSITESPLTRERVYVVTPQPLTPIDGRRLQPFKSPRFAQRQRPAPGSKYDIEKNSVKISPKNEKPRLSGRMDEGIEDLPEIETNDGHSNVVRIVTPDKAATVPLSRDSTTRSPDS